MIIRTSQDAALVDCCPCDPPACDAPRKECQSISVNACGYTLPTHPDVEPELRCVIYTVKTSSYEIDISRTATTTIGGSDVDYDEVNYELATSESKKFYVTESGERVCSGGQGATSFTETLTQTFDAPYEDYTNGYSANSSSTDGPGATCSGTQTYTYNDGTPTDTFDWDVCYTVSYSADASWSYAGGIFSRYTPTEGYTGGKTDRVEYSVPVTAAILTAELGVRIAMIDEGDPWGGSDCSSAIISTKTYSVQDPPAPPAEVDPEFVPVLLCSQVSSAVKARYRIGIPAAWADFTGRHAAWVIAHAAWVAADPETRGDEPVEPIERSYFQAQWDEVFFATDWEAWKELKDAHDVWVACGAEDPPREGGCGDEPEAPGAEPTAPSLVASRSWTYPGGGGSAEFSAWFEIAVPETEGETRVVNMLTKCHRNASLGVKPTSTGEVYELPE